MEFHKKKLPNRRYLDAKINTALSKVIEQKTKKHANILLYMPLAMEADITKTLRKMRKSRRVFVPFMEGASFKMVPYRLPLKSNAFGILEAGNSFKRVKKLDLAVVPAVGIDRQNKRVGFGKGMYDRFFAALRHHPYTVFVQRRGCFARANLCDAHDIAADLIIYAGAKLEKRLPCYMRYSKGGLSPRQAVL